MRVAQEQPEHGERLGGAGRLGARGARGDPREPALDDGVVGGERVARVEAEPRELLVLAIGHEVQLGVRALEQRGQLGGRALAERRDAQERAAVRAVDVLAEAALDGAGAVRIAEPLAGALGEPQPGGGIVGRRAGVLGEQLGHELGAVARVDVDQRLEPLDGGVGHHALEQAALVAAQAGEAAARGLVQLALDEHEHLGGAADRDTDRVHRDPALDLDDGLLALRRGQRDGRPHAVASRPASSTNTTRKSRPLASGAASVGTTPARSAAARTSGGRRGRVDEGSAGDGGDRGEHAIEVAGGVDPEHGAGIEHSSTSGHGVAARKLRLAECLVEVLDTG